jgi:hypothetical protein
MAEMKALIDQYGVIHEANKVLPDDAHRIGLIEALSELEDQNAYVKREFPKTRLHKVKGVKQSIYRADIQKTSGWRLHLQFEKQNGHLLLKDVVDGQDHDAVQRVIKAKKHRYV